MIGVGIRFPSGRFHATPWGRHVNEGAPEWPPSPWRILRAMVAAWKSKLEDQISQEETQEILGKLIPAPYFVLPPASASHSRHYMPWFKKGPLDKTLIFDAFISLSRDASVNVLWPDQQLTDQQKSQLINILAHIGYLGRAESWCTASLLSDAECIDSDAKVNCIPLNGEATPPDTEIVRVLCARPETVFSNEHTPKFEQISGGGKTKTITRIPLYDPDWHLCMETLELHNKRWSDPPGSLWVAYVRPRDCFKIEPLRHPRVSKDKPKMQVARFVLDSAVLPQVTETLPVAESARRMLMGICGRMFPTIDGSRGRSDIFSGKDQDAIPLEGHGHAYYLPADEDQDGYIDHLTIIAANGFDKYELKALDALRELKSNEREASGHPLRTMLIGMGRLEEYHPALLQPSRIWRSATPFIAPRFLKKRGTKRDPVELWNNPHAFLIAVLREEIARLIARRPELKHLKRDEITIKPLLDENGIFCISRHNMRPIQFKRFRQKKGDDGGNRPAGFFEIDFGCNVQGPIALGHSAHFGMGLFVPLKE